MPWHSADRTTPVLSLFSHSSFLSTSLRVDQHISGLCNYIYLLWIVFVDWEVFNSTSSTAVIVYVCAVVVLVEQQVMEWSNDQLAQSIMLWAYSSHRCSVRSPDYSLPTCSVWVSLGPVMNTLLEAVFACFHTFALSTPNQQALYWLGLLDFDTYKFKLTAVKMELSVLDSVYCVFTADTFEWDMRMMQSVSLCLLFIMGWYHLLIY